MRIISLLAAALLIALSAVAQPAEKFQPKERLSVEQEAQIKVDQMAQVLPLTKKQIKKLGKFFKNDIQYRRDNFEFAGGPRPKYNGERPQGPPPGGFPLQGMSPGGFHGGGPGMRPPSGRPPMMGGEVDIEEIEKYNQKQETKLKKILGDDLYTQWRSNHPMETPKLPEIKLQ